MSRIKDKTAYLKATAYLDKGLARDENIRMVYTISEDQELPERTKKAINIRTTKNKKNKSTRSYKRHGATRDGDIARNQSRSAKIPGARGGARFWH